MQGGVLGDSSPGAAVEIHARSVKHGALRKGHAIGLYVDKGKIFMYYTASII